MVHNNSGSQWIIGHVIWIITALALSGLLFVLYGSEQLWLSVGYWSCYMVHNKLWHSVGYCSCYMVHNNSGSQWVIGRVIWFTTALALSVLLVMLRFITVRSGSQWVIVCAIWVTITLALSG